MNFNYFRFIAKTTVSVKLLLMNCTEGFITVTLCCCSAASVYFVGMFFGQVLSLLLFFRVNVQWTGYKPSDCTRFLKAMHHKKAEEYLVYR